MVKDFKWILVVWSLGNVLAFSADTKDLSVSQARRELKGLLERMYRGHFNHSWRRVEAFDTYPLREIKVNGTGFEFEAPRDNKSKWTGARQPGFNHLTFRFRDLDPVTVDDRKRPHTPKDAYFAGPELKDTCTRECGTFFWTDRTDAERFAAALNRLIEAAKTGDPQHFEKFHAAATQWRALPSKPPLSASAEKHRILAEDSFRRNDIDGAAQHYDEALEEFPMWPEGWLNASLLYESLNDYEAAADRMRHYLELGPKPEEAAAAREKLVVWEEMAKR